MWSVSGTDMQMVNGDYGIIMPIKIGGVQISNSDIVTFTVNHKQTNILTKSFENIIDNTVNLELSQADSLLLPPGQYSYSLDWYQNGMFMCNIIPQGKFKVVDKI